MCENMNPDSPHFKGTIRFDARPRGTRIVANNVAPRGTQYADPFSSAVAGFSAGIAALAAAAYRYRAED